MRFTALNPLTLIAIAAFSQSSAALPESPAPATGKAAVDQLIPWLLDEDQQLRVIAFSQLIFDTTSRKVLPFDSNNVVDQRVAKAISASCDETIKRFNAPDSEVQHIDRINEVSSHFDDSLRELLNAAPGLHCDFPLTAEGKVQRSGYPDLRITDLASKRVFYLDPKLYATGSRDSRFRTFYFEPKKSTNKVRDNAVHFVVGFEHAARDAGASLRRGDSGNDQNTATERRGYNACWKFTRWDLFDLSTFAVKLKAEFQGSNRDMYRPEAIVASSPK
jgi:hypothetical protein